ncbi:hypothetical protein NKG05_18510 [Oerskovia sp. M15]
MKFLHAHLDVDAQGRERLRREAVALQRLRHPAVAQILDVELDGSEAFIVTELVDGPNLEEEIATGGPLDARTSSSSPTSSPRRSRRSTPRASCTATSSRATCW